MKATGLASRPQRRRTYRKKAAIEIDSIEFVPMSESERQQAIAVLAELFMPQLHHRQRKDRSASHGR